MVEFRWLRVHMGDLDGSHPSAIPMMAIPYLLILQYREEEGPPGEQWWGDWKDIPIVNADSV